MSNNADENQKFGEKVTMFIDNALSDSQETIFNNYLIRQDSTTLPCIGSVLTKTSNNNGTVNLHSQVAGWVLKYRGCSKN